MISVQIENEYGGPAEYMIALKKLAVDAGFDVPVYTRTGWPHTNTVYPFGEMLPLFGDYPDGFWDREITQAKGYRNAYLLNGHRAETGLGALVAGASGVGVNVESVYPYFCCEIGGGMASVITAASTSIRWTSAQ